MVWSAPRTWVANEHMTSALFNREIRNNLLETAPAKAAAAGDLLQATAANALAALAAPGANGGLLTGDANSAQWRQPKMDQAQTPFDISSTGWTTDGDRVSLTHDVGIDVLALFSVGNVSVDTAGGTALATAIAIDDDSGDDISGAQNARAGFFESTGVDDGGNIFHWVFFGGGDSWPGPEANTRFSVAYRVGTSGHTATFDNVRLLVWPIN